jgi:SAM-dependent methyltransferase
MIVQEYVYCEEQQMNRMTQANKKGWDGLARTHYKTYHIERLVAGKPLLNDLVREEVGDVRGKSLVHLLCHIGTDTLSWALLGAKVTGVDISPVSLQYARKLAKKMGIQADFIESDIMEARHTIKAKFDIAFSSTGVLCWIPDIRVYAQTVRQLLKDDGFFYIFDGHPFRNVMLDASGSMGNNTRGLFPQGTLGV